MPEIDCGSMMLLFRNCIRREGDTGAVINGGRRVGEEYGKNLFY